MAEVMDQDKLLTLISAAAFSDDDRARIYIEVVKLYHRVDELEDWLLMTDTCIACGEPVDSCCCEESDAPVDDGDLDVEE